MNQDNFNQRTEQLINQHDLEIALLKNECTSLQAQINTVAKYLDTVAMVVKDLNAIIHQKETI
jgi:hypothetical protein